MENIEFIAAKDLPTTEAEEVDVLCVEGGELKRKPGASLGGGAGGYMIKPTAEEITANDMQFVCTTNYDGLLKVLEVGGSGCVRIPTSVINADMATMIPYFVVAITSWGYISPEMSNNGVGVLMCHGAILLGDAVMDGLFVFNNGTYVPSWE